MRVSGFSYVRNGFTYGYPFIESILSVLPLCDEFIMVVGDSTDGTREAVEKINSPKIKIIDTVWDETMREGGKLFAQQANIGLDALTGDWALHIQADEVVHEKDLESIKQAMTANFSNAEVEGLLFDFYNFYGGFHHIGATRKWHRKEIRIVRNLPNIRSYRDSQGFRLYPSLNEYYNGHKGRSLKVKQVNAAIYHYSYARDPQTMRKKSNYFNTFWHNDSWVKEHSSSSGDYDYSIVDAVSEFTGTHPAIMKEKVAAQNWDFTYDASKAKFTLKNKILHFIEKKTGWRIGEYKNYKLI